MTIVYCDYTSGDDSNGTGTSALPYKTITKASTGLTGGDEVRVAQNAAATALSGTLSWTDGSATITTSADLSGVLAAKNFIRPTGETLPWEVLSVTTDTITLKVAYCGTTQTVASYKINPHDTGTAEAQATVVQEVSASGTAGNPLVISGGWNLSTLAQTGETWFLQSGSSLYGCGLYQNAQTDVTISDMGFLRYYYGIIESADSTGNYEDMYGVGCVRGFDLYTSNSKATISRLCCAGCTYVGLRVSPVLSTSCNLENISSYSSVRGIAVNNALGMIISNPIVKRCTTGFDIWGSYNIKLSSPTVENCTTGIQNDCGTELIVYNSSLTSNTTDMTVVNLDGSELPVLFSHKHGGVAGDNRAYGMYGVSQSNTADARTGVCLKVSPTSATQYFRQRIGLCRVASTGADITLGVYIKDDTSFNGTLEAAIYHLGECITDWAAWTPTTTYTLNTALADASDLVVGEMLELWIRVTGTAGSVYIDDSTPSYGSVKTEGYPAAGKLLQADGADGVVEASNTNSEVAAAVVASHTRSHSLISALDHSSLATEGQLLKANGDGLPIDATNTDTEVAAAVSATHTQNTDTYLDFGGTNEVTAADLKSLVDGGAAGVPGGSSAGDILEWDAVESKWVAGANGAILKTTLGANEVMVAISSATPTGIALAPSQMIGRKASGDTVALSAADILEIISVESGADVTDATNVASAGAVMESDYTAKGGIIIGTGEGTTGMLAAGPDTYVLTLDSGQTTGVKWAAATGGGAGISVHTPVACATTANITLSAEQTLDGVLTSTSRVLVKNQTAPEENGIYVSAEGAWARATDLDNASEVEGAYVLVLGGTTQGSTGWLCSAVGSGFVLGTTAMPWAQFTAAASGANVALSNLSSVALNTALLPDAAAADDFGSATLPFRDIYLAGSSGTPGTNNFKITGASTSGTRAITLPDESGTVLTTASGATKALDNLASVALNTALLPDAAAADDFGSATLPFKDIFLAGSSETPATNNFKITGASTSGTRTITLPDESGTVLTSVSTIANKINLTTGLSDAEYSGIAIAGTLGETVAFGELCYYDFANSKWKLAKFDAAATSSGLLGFCVIAGNDMDSSKFLRYGTIRANSAFPTFTGGPVFGSAATAGAVTETAPTGTEDFVVRVVGFGSGADELTVDIQPSYHTLTGS